MAENRRRRRKKNPLLMRILVISVVAHAIALPIAAHYGAFEKIKKSFGDSQVVMFTTPPIENKEKPAEKAKPKKAEPTKKAPGLKGKVASNGPPAPKVVAGGPATGDGGGGPSVEQGSGQAGVLPVTKTPGNEPPVTKPPVTEPPVTKLTGRPSGGSLACLTRRLFRRSGCLLRSQLLASGCAGR